MSIAVIMSQDKQSQRWRILLLVDFGFFLAIAAQTKIFEDVRCLEYYGSTVKPSEEADCKVALVHADLQARHRLSSLCGFLVCFSFWTKETWLFHQLYA